jgi:sugar phosphate isomerase/epimerase
LASDADLALRRVREAGFTSVEVAPLPPGLSPEDFTECLARHDLAVVSVHGELPTPDNIAMWARFACLCRCSQIIWHGWPRDSRFDDLAGIQDLISSCNEATELARDHGLRFGMHNHSWEFEAVEGESPIRLLHEALRPDVSWQLDVYWARTAGVEPSDVLRFLMPRISSLHWKDGPAVHGEPMTPLGRGKVDVPRLLGSLTRPVDWIIELDECATDPLEAARESRLYLESLRTITAGHPNA